MVGIHYEWMKNEWVNENYFTHHWSQRLFQGWNMLWVLGLLLKELRKRHSPYARFKSCENGTYSYYETQWGKHLQAGPEERKAERQEEEDKV